MKVKKVLFCLLALVIGSCVPVMSLHPLYFVSNTIYEPKLTGHWTNDVNGITMDFSRPEGEGTKYHLGYTMIDKETKKPMRGVFTVYLVKLGDKLFLDVGPEELPNGELDPNNYKWYVNAFFLVPGHSFAVVDSIEPQLKLRFTDDEKMKDFLEKNPDAVKHEIVSSDVILTANTAELQKFVIRFANDKNVFSNELTLRR